MKLALLRKGIMILDDLKAFITQNNLAQENSVKYDYDSANGENIILLNLYDSSPCDLARRSDIRITLKFSDLEKKLSESAHSLRNNCSLQSIQSVEKTPRILNEKNKKKGKKELSVFIPVDQKLFVISLGGSLID